MLCAGISQDLLAFSDSLKMGKGGERSEVKQGAQPSQARDGSLLRNKLDRYDMRAAVACCEGSHVTCSAIMTGRDVQEQEQDYDCDDYDDDDNDDGVVMDDACGKSSFARSGTQSL